MSFEWLQYVGNPYSVIAVIAGILGFSFKSLLGKVEKPKPHFILLMYGMFLLSILAIGIGGMALVFLVNGKGASDEIAKTRNHKFSFLNTTYAETTSPNKKIEPQKIKIIGWIWAGETIKIKNTKIQSKTKNEIQTQQINSQTLKLETIPEEEEKIITKTKANLRCDKPQFSWWKFRYQLGDLIAVLPEKILLKVIETDKVGKNIWLKVEIEM